MVPTFRTTVVDEQGRVRLPQPFDAGSRFKAGHSFTITRLSKGHYYLMATFSETLPAPKFKRALQTLKARGRTDIFQRLFIRQCLDRYRLDRGSFTGRIVFRHAVLAKRELFEDDWPLREYSEDYYRGRLVYPAWLVQALQQGARGPFIEVNAAYWRRLDRKLRAGQRRQARLQQECRRRGFHGIGLRRDWNTPLPLGIWFKLV